MCIRDSNQTAQMLGALSHWPQATFASEVKIEGDTAQVTREIDAGLETLSVDLPAVISVDLRLNEPRYVKLPDIMKAKRKPLDVKSAADFGIDLTARTNLIKVTPPAERKAGIVVESIDELVEKLKNEAKVIS